MIVRLKRYRIIDGERYAPGFIFEPVLDGDEAETTINRWINDGAAEVVTDEELEELNKIAALAKPPTSEVE